MMSNARRIEIGARLRECRQEVRLSLEAVAEELRLSRQAVHKWEVGSSKLDSERLADLSLIYGVSADYILFGTRMVPEDLRQLYQRVGAAGQAE